MNQQEVEDFVMKLGKKIRSLRVTNKMTQVELAAKSDIDERQIQRLENGHTSASLKTLLKVSHGLGIKISELLNI